MTLPKYLKPFRETVEERVLRDPEFAKALAEQHELAARVEALEKALRESDASVGEFLALRQAVIDVGGATVQLPDELIAKFAEMQISVVERSLKAREAARKLLEGKLAESVASEDELKDPANWGLDEKGQL